MRIVHVTDVYAPGVGGIERQVETLVLRQRAEGHEVTVVTASHRAFASPPTSEPGVVRRSHWATAVAPWPLAGPAPDLVHGHLSVVSPLTLRAVAVAAARGIPVVLTVHSLWPTAYRPLRLLLGALGGLPVPATWSAVSAVAAERVRRALPGRPVVHVVPNEVDTTWWQRAAAAPPAPGAAGSRPDVHAVLVNRLAGRKRVLPFVTLLATTMPPGLRVTIVGDGPRRVDIATAIDQHGLGDRVRLTGGLPPRCIRTVLHDADVFVAPARLESFGIAALEARAAGLPVLGFAGTGLADLVHHGRDGLLVGSDADLLAALTALVADRPALAALQSYARTTAPRVDAASAARAVDRLYAVATGRASEPGPATLRLPATVVSPLALHGVPTVGVTAGPAPLLTAPGAP